MTRRGIGTPEDVVYTPEWCAADMVAHFQPSGVVLDPCRGAGAFHDLLPDGSPWCEIEHGRDFFDWDDPVDWAIGNPPYSLTRPWFNHTMRIAAQFCYLVPVRNVMGAYGFLDEIRRYGRLAEMRVYGTGGSLGFPMGNAVAALHCVRGEDWGSTRFTWYQGAGAGEVDTVQRSLFGVAADEYVYVCGRGPRLDGTNAPIAPDDEATA